METILDVEGMTCSGCARNVREALAGVEGVEGVEIDLEGKSALVTWREPEEAPAVGRGAGIESQIAAKKKAAEKERAARLVRAVKTAGYGAKPRREREPGEPGRVDLEPTEKTGSLWSAPLFFLGLPVTLTLMVAEWGFGLNGTVPYVWLALVLTLPVQIGLGIPFYRNAWRQLFRNRLTMDTLVSLGSSAAFALSVVELTRFVQGGSVGHVHVFFLESSAILTLVGAGHWLEGRLTTRAGAALRALLTSVPATVQRFLRQGEDASRATLSETEAVPLSSLAKGDLVLVRPGDRIPIDGEIVEGHAAIDESVLTGESLPVEKGPGAVVRAGTFDTDGRLVVRVTGLGPETALAGIVRAVERAQTSRAEIERLVDRVSRHFVLAVITLAMLTFFGWGLLSGIGWEQAVLRAISVLVVACPCAMGLATPAALMAAANAASRRGILFRDAAAIEKTGKIDAVLFDKTGTLTGEVSVAAVEAIAPPTGDALPPEVFSALARALAAPSQHPLCRALVAHFPRVAPLAVEGWREERGAGVIARWEGRTVRLGSPAWLIASGVAFPDALLPRLGGGALALAAGEAPLGLFTFVKPVRPEAARVVAGLEKEGYAVYMVTGDAEAPARAVAREVGIRENRIFSGVRPEEKADVLVKLRAGGEGDAEKHVAFVGDGINDGPALAAADLGIAVVGASDVAREASDMVLLTRDLEAVPEALHLSAATLRVIRQNLFWAFFYNAATIPLAMAGVVPPVACALAMGLSDLCVMGNALRLLRYGRK